MPIAIADYVRLNAGYAPPHWKKSGGSKVKWDAGYETTAYFLDWIEKKYGDGTIRGLNERMKDEAYKPALFHEITGLTVENLWKEYSSSLDHLTERSGGVAEEVADVPMDEDLTEWPHPKLRIRVEDLDHEGAEIFYDTVKPKEALREAIMASFTCLYTVKTVPRRLVLEDIPRQK